LRAVITPSRCTIRGTLKVKDAPALFAALLGRIRPPWYRRAWDWIRGKRFGPPYTHVLYLDHEVPSGFDRGTHLPETAGKRGSDEA
jgi:hypothetical protein